MRLVFSDAAKSDLNAIFDYIAAENQAAAALVLQAVMAATAQLQEFPQSGRAGRVPETRELVMGNLPYILVYGVMQDAVVIFAVFHGARNIVQEMQERQK